MADLDRCDVVWSGGPGGAGLSVFYAVPGGGVAADLRAFFNSIKALIPSIYTIKVANTGDTIDDATGELVGSWSGPVNVDVGCVGAGDFASAAGAYIQWNTAGIAAGRRVRGRTFIVPVIASVFSASGGIDSAGVAILQPAATTLTSDAGGNLAIWSRPNASRPGSTHLVVSATVPSKMAVLTSRRD